MPQKGSIGGQILEQLSELGRETVKQTVKAVTEPFNPLKMAEQIAQAGGSEMPPELKQKLEAGGKNQSATALDYNKLDKSYQRNSQDELAQVRRQFNLVKGEEQRAINSAEQNQMRYSQMQQQAEAEKQRKQQMAAQENQTIVTSSKPKRGQRRPQKTAETRAAHKSQ